MYMTELFSIREDVESTRLATNQDTVQGFVRELSMMSSIQYRSYLEERNEPGGGI
jgi:hypothetical protein